MTLAPGTFGRTMSLPRLCERAGKGLPRLGFEAFRLGVLTLAMRHAHECDREVFRLLLAGSRSYNSLRYVRRG